MMEPRWVISEINLNFPQLEAAREMDSKNTLPRSQRVKRIYAGGPVYPSNRIYDRIDRAAKRKAVKQERETRA